MREILFRAKRKLDDKWIYGNIEIEPRRTMMHYYNEEAVWVETGVFLETVGQYTGLQDKNGKKIFEGDIVLQPVREKRKHSPCIIEFHEGAFMAHYKSENRFFDRYYDINSYTKVIGNIHDNPELLKGVCEE